jgi:hypothetical protein
MKVLIWAIAARRRAWPVPGGRWVPPQFLPYVRIWSSLGAVQPPWKRCEHGQGSAFGGRSPKSIMHLSAQESRKVPMQERMQMRIHLGACPGGGGALIDRRRRHKGVAIGIASASAGEPDLGNQPCRQSLGHPPWPACGTCKINQPLHPKESNEPYLTIPPTWRNIAGFTGISGHPGEVENEFHGIRWASSGRPRCGP